MRKWLTILSMTLLLGSPAFAGKKDKDDDKEPPQIEMTGLSSLDDMFTKVKGIDDRLNNAKAMLKTSKIELNNALGLEKGTPIKDGLEDLKGKGEGKMKVAMKGNKPTLEASDAVPENVQNAIDAVNKMVDNITGSMEELAGVPEEAQGLAAEAADAPSKAKDDLKSSGKNPMEQAKALKVVGSNAKITADLPAKATDVVERMGNLLAIVADLAPKSEDGEAAE